MGIISGQIRSRRHTTSLQIQKVALDPIFQGNPPWLLILYFDQLFKCLEFVKGIVCVNSVSNSVIKVVSQENTWK